MIAGGNRIECDYKADLHFLERTHDYLVEKELQPIEVRLYAARIQAFRQCQSKSNLIDRWGCVAHSVAPLPYRVNYLSDIDYCAAYYARAQTEPASALARDRISPKPAPSEADKADDRRMLALLSKSAPSDAQYRQMDADLNRGDRPPAEDPDMAKIRSQLRLAHGCNPSYDEVENDRLARRGNFMLATHCSGDCNNGTGTWSTPEGSYQGIWQNRQPVKGRLLFSNSAETEGSPGLCGWASFEGECMFAEGDDARLRPVQGLAISKGGIRFQGRFVSSSCRPKDGVATLVSR